MKNKFYLLGSILIILGALIGVGITQFLNLDMGQVEERTHSYEVFYLSVGLYQNETHPCFNHDIVKCKAEFKGEEVTFYIKSYNSSYEIHGSGFTTAQGFLDLYLPKDQTYFAEFEVKDLEGSGVITTTQDSPTCITTIRINQPCCD
jgi:hypothetical protein